MEDASAKSYYSDEEDPVLEPRRSLRIANE